MGQTEEWNRNVRVLIVEDNVNQLRTLVDIVELEGFPVAACSTATEALALAQRERFGVIIMDLRLPDGDGVHLLEQLRALDSNQRIIINTGFASLDSAKEAVNLGAFAYVEKAGDPEELVRHLHRAHAVYLSSYAKELEFAVAERTAALHQSESDYRMLMEQSADGIFISDGQGNCTLVNAEAGRMLGYTRDELERMNVRELVLPDVVPSIDPWLEELRRGAALSIECPLRCKDGSKKIVEVRACMLSDGRIQSNLRDITERKRMEEELRESEELFRTLAETSQAGILILEGEKIVYCNPALQSRSGYSHEELSTMPFWQLAAPEFREQLQLLNVALQQGNEIPINYELKIITKSGEERWIQGSIGRLSFHGRQAVLAVTMDITERKTTEAALRESEALFRTLAETSEAGILISQGAKILYANPALSRQNGYSREEMSTMEPWAPLAPEFRERAIRRVRAHQRGERVEIPAQEEVKVITKSGAEQWVRMYRAYVTFLGVPASMSVIVDVTERRRMEDKLRASEARFRVTFEQAAVGMAHVSLEGRFFLVNQKLCNIFGYAEDELYQMSCDDLTHPDDRTVIARETQRIMAGEISSFVLEKRCIHKNGTVVWITLTSALVHGAHHEPLYFVDVIEDISARKQIEAEQQRLVAILENTTDFIVTTTVDGRGVYMNRAGRALMGLHADADLGAWESRNAYTPQSREMVVRQAIPTALRTGTWAGEAIAVSSLGEEFPISQVIVAHKGENGRAQYLSVLGRDISEQKRAEAVLQALPRELLAVQENERRRIAHELHDEIGQVLTAIKINLQTIQRMPQTLASRLEESVNLVEKVLQQVRTLSLDLRPPMLDDLGLVAALRWHLDQRAQRAGLALQFEADPASIHPPQEIAIVCFRIVQEALTNILRHAHARQVHVELRQDHAALSLRIRNDGETFDVDKAKARARRGESTGLVGMQERAQMVGGRVDIVSCKGKGTEVSVWLPLSIIEAHFVMRNGK